MGVPNEMLTCDFWGRKQEASYKKYLLTCCKKPYKVMKQFAMCMKPLELNVMETIQGEGIYLYDTEIKAASHMADKQQKARFLEYGYGVINGRDLFKWALIKMYHKYRDRK